uniref:Uncharacterized protein n=1 Tax=Panagrolaimus sp. ES5 TaxID=591445 RepID=A0AC34EZT8_9BILA
MAEPPSKTSNHQRVEEMMAHLTPKGATIPYNLAFDSDNCIWVASKGGLFKLNPEGDKVLVENKNIFPKKFAPYCQVVIHGNKVIHAQCEDVADITEFRILDLEGNIEHEQFIDGKIQSLAVSSNGAIFLTKQPAKGADEFFIYKTSIDVPLGWDEFASEFDLCYQSLCCLDDSNLVAATCSIPNNIYSKQNIVILDAESGKLKKKFSEAGKEAGQIYFPRSIQSYHDGILVLDKTGRIQHFGRDGNLIAESARIDAYIGNGFVVRNDEAVIACSGIVRAADGESICDDWIEAIKLDGSFWTEL